MVNLLTVIVIFGLLRVLSNSIIELYISGPSVYSGSSPNWTMIKRIIKINATNAINTGVNNLRSKLRDIVKVWMLSEVK